MRKNRVLKLMALALVATLGCGAYLAAPAAKVVTGYAAKIACSALYVANRDMAQVQREDLAFLPMSSFLDLEADLVHRSVTARLGPVSQRAIFRAGLGSTLLLGADEKALGAQRPLEGFEFSLPTIEARNAAPAALDAALDRAFAEPDPKRPRRTRAVVVVNKGAVIAERYAPGFSSDTPFLGWSMSKSVLNALVGIRVREGKLKVTDKAGCPEWSAPGDPRAEITIDQLMHMSSGLAFDERYSDPKADAVQMLFLSRDTAAYAATKPLPNPPGSVWAYSSGTTNILSRALRASFAGDDRAYLRFPATALFEAIGARSAVMEPDASGTFVASSFTYMRAREWARFGLLYLHDGVWNGKRILPEGWVKYSTTPAPAAPQGRYGAQFWLNAGSPGHPEDRPMPTLPPDLFYCAGFQDQSVVIVPSRDAVIVRLGLTDDEDAWDLEKFVKDVLDALP